MASSNHALPGYPVTDDELHSIGFAAHEISLRATYVPLPDGLGCEWVAPGDVPDSPGLYAFTVVGGEVSMWFTSG